MANAGGKSVWIKNGDRSEGNDIAIVDVHHHGSTGFDARIFHGFLGGFLNFNIQCKYDVAAGLWRHGNGIRLPIAEVVDQQGPGARLAAQVGIEHLFEAEFAQVIRQPVVVLDRLFFILNIAF